VSAPAPAADSRLHSLDVLRALALFGMILVHFHQKMGLDVARIEDLIGWGVYIFVEQKAWGTFAFLFGVGFAVLLRRLEACDRAVAPIYLRRLGVLAGFGLVAKIGFGFNILFSYAAWGIALLVIRHWPSRVLLATAAAAAMAIPVTEAISAVYAWLTGIPALPGSVWPLAQAVERAAAQAPYTELLAARWRLFVATTPGGWRGLLPDSNLALFIVGLLAVRHGVIDEPLRHTRLIRGWMAFGALSWLAAWTVLRRFDAISITGVGWRLAMGLGLIRDQWLCFTYIGAVVLFLAYRPQWGARLMPVAQAGRMALTNYMLQIVVLDVLASGYGFAVRLRPALYLPATLLLFGSEVMASRLWLGHFRHGPLEWLWRTTTYLRATPLRRLRAASGSA
jgi:uncharacterized protein